MNVHKNGLIIGFVGVGLAILPAMLFGADAAEKTVMILLGAVGCLMSFHAGTTSVAPLENQKKVPVPPPFRHQFSQSRTPATPPPFLNEANQINPSSQPPQFRPTNAPAATVSSVGIDLPVLEIVNTPDDDSQAA